MARITTKPIFKTFKLECDKDAKPGEQAEVVIGQARMSESIQRADLFAKQRRIWNDRDVGEVKVEQDWNPLEQRRKEVWLTLRAATNIIADEDGKELFPSKTDKEGVPFLNMSETAFNRAWGFLSDEMTKEIHEYVLEMNPEWDPDNQGE